MVANWYYAHADMEKVGPFSPTQLKELAAAGSILPIDTVWLEGNATGVLASRVRHLFAPDVALALRTARTSPVAIAADVSVSPPVANATQATQAEIPAQAETVLTPAPKSTPKERPKNKGRAVALTGADIVSQDGAYARYRKKCMKCAHKDASCHMITITNKLFKANFFCPKCRKRREVAIQCHA